MKARKIRPGMVIETGGVTMLLAAVTGWRELEIIFWDVDHIGERLSGTIKGSEKVKLIEGEARAHTIDVIRERVLLRLRDLERDFEMIRLIEEIK